ncbi:IS1 family transposase, partial [Enterobacter hormaechei]
SLSFSKSVELHDKVIGHCLNIKHYQQVGVITNDSLRIFKRTI